MFLILRLFIIGLLLIANSQLAHALDATVGSAFVYQASSSVNAPQYALIGAPMGMSINPRTGKIYWTPTSNQVGNNQVITVRVSSGASQIDTVLTLNVAAGAAEPANSYFVAPESFSGTVASAMQGTLRQIAK